MANPRHRRTWIFEDSLQAATVALTLAIGFVLTLACAQSAQAQTFTVLHSFTGGADGQAPRAGLAINRSGDLFGATVSGGNTGGVCGTGCGTVFRLSHKGSSWIFTTLYAFQGNNDGWQPFAGVTIGSDGNLYGTTFVGGGVEGPCAGAQGCGTVFKLQPPASICKAALCPWTETILYRFAGGNDGGHPEHGALIFDRAGNICSTTSGFGSGGQGVVYELTFAGGSWMESVLYSFTGGADGGSPGGPVIFDGAGNLYGVASSGGFNGGGTVYQLTPAGSGWTQSTIHTFDAGNDGAKPFGGLILDQSGNLDGTTSTAGPGNGGTVYQLSRSGGNWTFTLPYSFETPGAGPTSGLAIDATGNLYGTAAREGAYGYGMVFELSPHADGSWTFTDLHDFTGGIDGAYPLANVTLDSAGNLYGTTFGGGAYGKGAVFEITLN